MVSVFNRFSRDLGQKMRKAKLYRRALAEFCIFILWKNFPKKTISRKKSANFRPSTSCGKKITQIAGTHPWLSVLDQNWRSRGQIQCQIIILGGKNSELAKERFSKTKLQSLTFSQTENFQLISSRLISKNAQSKTLSTVLVKSRFLTERKKKFAKNRFLTKKKIFFRLLITPPEKSPKTFENLTNYSPGLPVWETARDPRSQIPISKVRVSSKCKSTQNFFSTSYLPPPQNWGGQIKIPSWPVQPPRRDASPGMIFIFLAPTQSWEIWSG